MLFLAHISTGSENNDNHNEQNDDDDDDYDNSNRLLFGQKRVKILMVS